MLALTIIGVYAAGWFLSTLLFIVAMEADDGELAFLAAMAGILWPVTLIPQIAYMLYNYKGQLPAISMKTRKERKLKKTADKKRRELVAAQEVRRLQDEIDRIALS